MLVTLTEDEGVNIYMRGQWPGGRQLPPFEESVYKLVLSACCKTLLTDCVCNCSAIADTNDGFIDVHRTVPASQFAHVSPSGPILALFQLYFPPENRPVLNRPAIDLMRYLKVESFLMDDLIACRYRCGMKRRYPFSAFYFQIPLDLWG